MTNAKKETVQFYSQMAAKAEQLETKVKEQESTIREFQVRRIASNSFVLPSQLPSHFHRLESLFQKRKETVSESAKLADATDEVSFLARLSRERDRDSRALDNGTCDEAPSWNLRLSSDGTPSRS